MTKFSKYGFQRILSLDRFNLQMRVRRSFEASGTAGLMTQHQVPKDLNFQQYRCENNKPHIILTLCVRTQPQNPSGRLQCCQDRTEESKAVVGICNCDGLWHFPFKCLVTFRNTVHSVTLRQPYFTPTKLAFQETNRNCATLAFYLREALYRLLHEQCGNCSCCSTSLHILNIVRDHTASRSLISSNEYSGLAFTSSPTSFVVWHTLCYLPFEQETCFGCTTRCLMTSMHSLPIRVQSLSK